MANCAEMEAFDVEFNVVSELYPSLKAHEIEQMMLCYHPATHWEDCYPVMDKLMEITGGVLLDSDGGATAEIAGKKEHITGGHCWAICVLYLLALEAVK